MFSAQKSPDFLSFPGSSTARLTLVTSHGRVASIMDSSLGAAVAHVLSTSQWQALPIELRPTAVVQALASNLYSFVYVQDGLTVKSFWW